ncbi:MAG: deoxyribonuclease IV [Lachnospiraceae bacterium]|jgi:deoxyribonuclease-4|nr:deoxyribonuclease IV [Lachnospiraceae bacterium]
MLKIGSHVGMNGKKMMLGSVEEALSYNANTFMLYTGAPQNTKRKEISELNIEAAQALMKDNGITEFIVHAPYIINLANTVKPETYELAVRFLRLELDRASSMGSRILVVHPGAHVGAGTEAGIASVVKGLNEVLTDDSDCLIALETMAGKGSEIGRTFEELARIYDGVAKKDRLRICFDTCHTHDSGYDIINDPEGVFARFDQILGKDQIAVFHINDSKNPCGSAKDRHENLGKGCIGFDALNRIVHHPDFQDVPKILETPWIPVDNDPKNTRAPYKEEIAMLREHAPA